MKNHHAYSGKLLGFKSFSLCFIFLFVTGHEYLRAQVLDYAGMGSADASNTQFSASGGSGNEVSPYTGQHAALFPIASIPATGMPIDVGVNLTYSGNVSQVTRLNNNETQVSWVGLGFSFGQDAIVADHKGTADIYDDDYFYTNSSGESYQLVHQFSSSNNFFKSPTGFKDGFVFQRVVATFEGVEAVVGWTLRKGNGFLNSFGDFATDTLGRNATSYALRWEHSLIPRTGAGDKLYPVRWELKKIENGIVNYVAYSYVQERARLNVDNDTATTSAGDSTDNQYTRAIHVSEISTSSEYSIKIIFGTRTDVPDVGNSTNFHMFGTKRIDSIYVEYRGNRLSRTALNYEYLNVTTDRPEYSKLFLKNIIILDSSGLNSLPATDFEYYQDTSLTHWGSIKSITYPQGAKKDFVYTVVDTSKIFTTLNYTDTLKPSGPFPFQGGYVAYSSSAWIKVYRGNTPSDTAWSYNLGAWNGFWQTDVIEDLTDVKYDSAVAAGNGWVVTYNHRLGSFIHFSWQGGGWTRDTIPWPVDPSAGVRIFAGERYFVAIEIHAGAIDGYEDGAKKGSFFRYADGTWFSHEIFSFGDFARLAEVRLASDMYSVMLKDTTKHNFSFNSKNYNVPYFGEIRFGKYDSQANVVVEGNVTTPGGYPWLQYAIGSDYISWFRQHIEDFGIGIVRFDGTIFNTTWIAPIFSVQIDQVVALASGISWVAKEQTVNIPVKIQTYMFDGSSGITSTIANSTGDLNVATTQVFPSGGNSFAFRFRTSSPVQWQLLLADWTGTIWTTTPFVLDCGADPLAVNITDNIATVWLEKTHQLWGKRRNLDGTWGVTDRLNNFIGYWANASIPLPPELGVAKDIVLTSGNEQFAHSAVHRFAYTWDDFTNKWDTLDLEVLTEGDGSTTARFGAYGGRFMYFSVGSNLSFFQKHRDGFIGKPRCSVVEDVLVMNEGPLSKDTIVTSMFFEGGVLDEGASSLRFARSAVSEPHDIDSGANSWSISYFYNNLDNDKFVIPGIALPDLDSSFFEFNSTKKVWRGGYLLDGREYLSIDSSKDGSGVEQADSVSTDYGFFVKKETGTSHTRFGPTPAVTRSKSIVNGVSSEIKYTRYDDRGRVAETSIPAGDGYDLVNVTSFAWGANPKTKLSLLKSVDTTIKVSFEMNEWASPVNRSRSYILPDPDAGDFFSDTTFVVSSDTQYVNSDSGQTVYQRVETHTFTIDSLFLPESPSFLNDSLWYQPWEIEYEFELKSSHLGEFCLIKRNGDTIDILSSIASFKPATDLLLCGSFRVNLGDQIEIILDNSVGRPFGGGETWCKAKIFQRLTRVDEGGVARIETFSLMNGLPGRGIDEHHNLLSWTTTDMDTSGAKFSSTNGVPLASISNGFVNNVFLFDAENSDFTSSPFGFDNWENVAGTRGSISSDEQFTGASSFKITNNASTQISLRRCILADSLVRKEYLVDYWAMTGGSVTATLYGYSGGSSCTSTSHVFQPASATEWEHKRSYFSLDSCGSLDSAAIEFAFTPDLVTLDTIAYLDNIRFHPIDAQVTTTVYSPITGKVSSSLQSDNIPTTLVYDSFQRLAKTLNYKGTVMSEVENVFSRDLGSNIYDAERPNRTITQTHDGVITRKVVSFTDGVGTPLQQRSITTESGAPQVLVTGSVVINVQGQIVKVYKPYIDLVGVADVDSFTIPSEVENEAKNYYNGINNISLGNFPFSENKFEVGLRNNLKKSSSPGTLLSMATGKVYSYDRTVEMGVSDTFNVITTTDPDGLRSARKVSRDGKRTVTVKYYDKNGLPDSVLSTNHVDIYNRTAWISVQFSSDDSIREVQRSFPTYLPGRVDSLWTFEGGMVHTFYDNSGRMRFKQNQRQKSIGEFSYVKYDEHGRSIEHGTLSDTTKFNQLYAKDRSFPASTDLPSVKYRWYFDFHVVNGDTLSQPGQLVRVENVDSSYYKEFHIYSEDDSAVTIIKLPIAGGSLKAIKYETMIDGKLERMEVRPNVNNQSTWRAIEYDYDATGRISSVRQGLITGEQSTLYYAKYEYDANDLLKEVLLGADALASYDAVQRVNYTYNARGRLEAINRPKYPNIDDLVGNPTGGYAYGFDNDHYAMDLQFFDGSDSTYANGRPSWISVRNSTQSSTILEHKYDLTYDDRGWLVEAKHQADNAYDRKYIYNDMGLRTKIIKGAADTTSYVYDPQTLRFLGFSTTSQANQCKYDAAGNLIADSSRSIYEQRYDYRNLLSYSRVAASAGGFQDTLNFEYDENEQRIMKRHWYKYWSTCGGGGGYIPPVGMLNSSPVTYADASSNSGSGFILTGTGGGGVPCLKIAIMEKHYLYDNGVLLATFDESDNVSDLFINGPSGRIANYKYNADNSLVYYLNDHQGSPRVMMQPSTTPQMSYYAHYYPFGSLLEEWSGGSFNSYNYAGKETDKHSSFDYQYFGSRYYDSRIGQFTSLDKANQFYGGYRYGNNPITSVDPDGNLNIFTDVAIPAAFAFVPGAQGAAALWAFRPVGYAIVDSRGDPLAVLKATGFVILGGEVSKIGGRYGAVGSGVAVVVNNAIAGQPLTQGVVTHYVYMGVEAGIRAGAAQYKRWRNWKALNRHMARAMMAMVELGEFPLMYIAPPDNSVHAKIDASKRAILQGIIDGSMRAIQDILWSSPEFAVFLITGRTGTLDHVRPPPPPGLDIGTLEIGGEVGVSVMSFEDNGLGGLYKEAGKAGYYGTTVLAFSIQLQTAAFTSVLTMSSAGSMASVGGSAWVYRVYGGGAKPFGRFWTTMNPAKVSSFRAAAGLPDVNTGRFVLEATIRSSKGFQYGRASLFRGGNTFHPGGLQQIVIPKSRLQLNVRRVSGVNPDF